MAIPTHDARRPARGAGRDGERNRRLPSAHEVSGVELETTMNEKPGNNSVEMSTIP